MRKMALVVFLFLIPTFSFAFGDATPTALTNLRWRVASAPELSGCVQMTDIVLDVYTANTYQGGLFGYATCNTASGPLVYPMTGTLLVTQAGYGISLYVTDMRLFCTLSSSTLSSNACQIYQIAGGNLIGSFSMTFVP